MRHGRNRERRSPSADSRRRPHEAARRALAVATSGNRRGARRSAARRSGDRIQVLPRRTAAAVFEYMPPAAQLGLVKAMGQQDVAELLNRMSPDDRTLLLSEAPANV